MMNPKTLALTKYARMGNSFFIGYRKYINFLVMKLFRLEIFNLLQSGFQKYLFPETTFGLSE